MAPVLQVKVEIPISTSLALAPARVGGPRLSDAAQLRYKLSPPRVSKVGRAGFPAGLFRHLLLPIRPSGARTTGIQ